MAPDRAQPTYLVVGLGRAGEAAAQRLAADRSRPRVLVWDAARTPATEARARRLRAQGVEIWLGGDGAQLPRLDRPLTVIKSPGISFDIPLLRSIRTAGHQVIDELEFGWGRCPRPVAAVTGTNGKSTTSALVAAVLGAAGHRVALAGNTEFGPPLSAAPECDWVVCEVSSFQLEGSPTFRPKVAIFTNLTPEHLDRHGSMERYGAAKARMFAGPDGTAGMSVINIDDRFGRELAGLVARAGGRLITYGEAPGADARIEDARWDLRRAVVRVRLGGVTTEVQTQLPGAHNAHNVAAALAVAHGLGLPSTEVHRALSTISAPPGRWQVIDEGQPFTVIVDYAHTPDGIAQVLGAMRAATRSQGGGRVRTVFGAVGLADAVKARDSALALSQHCDELVLDHRQRPQERARRPPLRAAARRPGRRARPRRPQPAGGD